MPSAAGIASLASMWCVGGAPLPAGKGWRIWYARIGSGEFQPQKVVVTQSGNPVPTTQSHQPVPSPPEFGRQICIVSVKLDQPQPNRKFTLAIPEIGRSVHWQAMPDRIPDDGMSFIFASCYWNKDDKAHVQKAMNSILKFEKPRPAFKLLIGDQIYLDVPFPKHLPSKKNHAEQIANRYYDYWGDPDYREMMLATPNFFVCDDHEFWNNFPERQPQLIPTWSKTSREQYQDIAQAYYESFQRRLNPAGNSIEWVQFEIDPASFFIMDSRSKRSRKDARSPEFLSKNQWDALKNWQQGLRGPGILVLGQPVLQKDGDWKDYSLSNFGANYAELLNLIERSMKGENKDGRPHDILMLSGDIHTGRHAIVTMMGLPGQRLHEFIASPSARVTGADDFTTGPKPELPPGRIKSLYFGGQPIPRNIIWTVRKDHHGVPFTTVNNNMGVLRMFLSEKANYRLRVEFCNYLVRRHRHPKWKIFSRRKEVDFEDQNQLRLYESKKKIEINLL